MRSRHSAAILLTWIAVSAAAAQPPERIAPVVAPPAQINESDPPNYFNLSGSEGTATHLPPLPTNKAPAAITIQPLPPSMPRSIPLVTPEMAPQLPDPVAPPPVPGPTPSPLMPRMQPTPPPAPIQSLPPVVTLVPEPVPTPPPQRLTLGPAALTQTPPPSPAAVPCGSCMAPKSLLPNVGWVAVDGLLWKVRGFRLPALVTASPGGAPADSAVIGIAETRVLFGEENYANQDRLGARIRAGFWLDGDQTYGFEASYFLVGSASEQFTANPGPENVIGRPFVDATTGRGASELVTFPGLVSGGVTVDVKSANLQGGDLGFCKKCVVGGNSRVDLLVGLRLLRLSDSLDITENLVVLDPAAGSLPAGTRRVVNDNFQTSNTYYGGYVGLAGEYSWQRWFFGFNGKLALGYNDRVLRVNGSTSVTLPASDTAIRSGGLLALSSNIGAYQNNSPVFLPEAGLTLGYALTPNFRIHAGYTCLYWDRLWRPGEQIDFLVNPNLVPPADPTSSPDRPRARLSDTSLWLQGVNAGVELRF